MPEDVDLLPIGEIVQKARDGEEQIWRVIADRLYPWALRVARRRLSDKALAEDAVQESFLVAFTSLDALRDIESFPSWLAAIIKSQCSQLSSRLQKSVSLDRLDDCGMLPMGDVRTPEDDLHTMRLFGHFDEAVNSLPEHLRIVSRQRFLLGSSIAEIARITGLAEGTVKKRLHGARRLLREKMLSYRGEQVFRVGFMPISDHLLPMVTEHLFREERLSLLLKRYLSWSALAGDLRRGRLDAGFIMVPLAMHLVRTGVPLLHVMDAHHDGSSLAVALHGRMQSLGLPARHSTHRALLDRLAETRPELQDLKTQFISPSYALASMRNKRIDSFFCAEPWGTRCSQEKLGQILIRSKDIVPGHTCCILAVREEFALKRSDIVRDYVSLLLKARDRTHKDPSFVAMIQSRFTGIALDTATHVLEQQHVSFDDLKPDKQRVMAMIGKITGRESTSKTYDLDRFVCTDFV